MQVETADKDRRQPKFYCPHCGQVFGLLPELGAGDLAVMVIVCPGCGQHFFVIKQPDKRKKTDWVALPLDSLETKRDLPPWLSGVLSQIMENRPHQVKRVLPDGLKDWLIGELGLAGKEE
ncbi:MAG: hypothetical protein A3H67_01385 [Candidatus Buchananbacteria bacterium RIFCSPLOWO2_02_FULL_46_11b]|uniref:Uncharacterized protein n=1 Tax=Candidatus Buchananbacteria bacterium RIFCSPLOWO2_02_FULL_46_11b TaxID=1797548 RepID=A0A1G1YWN8_9BACT|nr:MAG: hypothetical protein A3H67_01385 [Candidatus Buchananbacteria bacterium RIFCSPLOWO2_02_FULL_46_11b]